MDMLIGRAHGAGTLTDGQKCIWVEGLREGNGFFDSKAIAQSEKPESNHSHVFVWNGW